MSADARANFSNARRCVLPSERLNVPKFVCRLRPQPKPSRNLSEPQTWVNKPTIAALERRLLAAGEAPALGNAAFLRPRLVVSLALRVRTLFSRVLHCCRRCRRRCRRRMRALFLPGRRRVRAHTPMHEKARLLVTWSRRANGSERPPSIRTPAVGRRSSERARRRFGVVFALWLLCSSSFWLVFCNSRKSFVCYYVLPRFTI